MNSILYLKSSLNGEQGQSNILSDPLIGALKSQATVIERDLAANPLPHLSQEEMAAWMAPADERNDAQQALVHISDTLIKELQASQTLVIAMPMYNFGVPSTFKAWIDRVARAGITFKYTENGPVGLLEDKKVIVIATRGGLHAGSETDTQSPYLRHVFGLLGITDIQFIYAEGLNMTGSEARFAAAEKEIAQLSTLSHPETSEV